MFALIRPPLLPQTGVELGNACSAMLEHSHSEGLVCSFEEGATPTTSGWHRHAACELRIIVGGAGLAFVGDWIGPFGPIHVVLTGLHLPHRWWWLDEPDAGAAERHRVIRFAHEPLEHAGRGIQELVELSPLLARARQGMEFFGFAERTAIGIRRIQDTRGLQRLSAFCNLMAELGAWTDHRTLSTVPTRGGDDADVLQRIEAAVLTPADRLLHPIAAADCAADLGMSESRFSRCFRRHTGRTFTDFVSRVRSHCAANLLLNSDRPVAHICKEVGIRGVAGFNRRFFEIKGTTPSEFRRQACLLGDQSD